MLSLLREHFCYIDKTANKGVNTMSKKRGRKNKYDSTILPRWSEIEELKKKGLTEKEIARKIGISYSSWNKYKAEIKEFSELCNTHEVDAEVIEEARSALHRRATGYLYTETKEIYEVNEEGEKRLKKIEKTTKYAEPDVNAINLFLKNYDKNNWSNDPQMYELRKRELELKEKEFEKNNW